MTQEDKEQESILYWYGCYTWDWWLGQRCIDNKIIQDGLRKEIQRGFGKSS